MTGMRFQRTLGSESNHPFFFSQVDLGQDKMVSGVVIQGGKHRDRNVFMKRFKVGHSLDGEVWTIIKDNATKPKVGSTRVHSTCRMKGHFLLNYRKGVFSMYVRKTTKHLTGCKRSQRN